MEKKLNIHLFISVNWNLALQFLQIFPKGRIERREDYKTRNSLDVLSMKQDRENCFCGALTRLPRRRGRGEERRERRR